LLTEIDGRIAPRSGLASKNFIDTGAGVIDADYRGEVKVLLFNFSDVDFTSTPLYNNCFVLFRTELIVQQSSRETASPS
jgi:dUTPase